jgi:lipid-A-disaccharide synthase-like uncharacterized protein
LTGGLVTIGLVLIILSWLVQLYYSAAKKIFALSLKFVAIYVLGSIFIVIEAFQTGNTLIWISSLVTAIIAFLAGYFAKKARP